MLGVHGAVILVEKKIKKTKEKRADLTRHKSESGGKATE
jgi:hypothetical protein